MHPTVLLYRASAVVKVDVRRDAVPPRLIPRGLSDHVHGTTAVVLRQRVKYQWVTRRPDGSFYVYRQTEFLEVDDHPPVCCTLRLCNAERPGELLKDRIAGLGLASRSSDRKIRETICGEVRKSAEQAWEGGWKSMLVEVEVHTLTVLSYDRTRCLLPPVPYVGPAKERRYPVEELVMEVYHAAAEGEGCGGADTEEACSICMDDFVPGAEVERLPCGHRFHGECALRWLESSGSCPMCRSEFRVK